VRLAALNRLTNRPFVEFLGVRPGWRVLEVGSGLGILSADVSAFAAGVRVVGVERSPEQLRAAARSPRVAYVQGDAHHLGFAEASFDAVYARYLLEHVADPLRVLDDMRRVVRPRGCVAVCENDISLLRVDPPCPMFEAVWDGFRRHQRSLGGDPDIGRHLYRLLTRAGLRRVELSLQPEVHWHGSPGFAGWIQNIVGNLEGARAGLVRSGVTDDTGLDRAIAELRAVSGRDDASSCFVWNRARGVRED
jgi:SAM-dependent methyltransferase